MFFCSLGCSLHPAISCNNMNAFFHLRQTERTQLSANLIAKSSQCTADVAVTAVAVGATANGGNGGGGPTAAAVEWKSDPAGRLQAEMIILCNEYGISRIN